jgi:hypothetical protein
MIGDPANNTTYYLVPGIVPIANISTSTAYPITYQQTIIVYSIYMKFSGTIGGGQSVTFRIYKNNVATALTVTLTATGSVSKTTSSVTFSTTDTLDARFITVGNVGSGTFFGSILTY